MALERLSLQSYNYTVEHYTESRDKFTLDAPYQRGSVWGVQHRQALIKSMLMGLPIGAIVVNFRGYAEETIYSVVDGKQRIEALRAFADGEFTVDMTWFEDSWLEEEDRGSIGQINYPALSLRGRRGFRNLPMPTLQATVSGIPAEANIYGLINTAGVTQTAADISNAARYVTG